MLSKRGYRRVSCYLCLGALLSPVMAGANAVASPASLSASAHQAVEAAVSACRDQGYAVTATVVNSDGLIIAVLRGEHAAPHTFDSSRQKAYTAASFAPIVSLDKTSQIAERLVNNPASAQLANLPGVLLLGGGLAIRSQSGEVIGGIGVGGAPGGLLDEGCAAVGLERMNMKNR